jgi:hypothetical protein
MKRARLERSGLIWLVPQLGQQTVWHPSCRGQAAQPGCSSGEKRNPQTEQVIQCELSIPAYQ